MALDGAAKNNIFLTRGAAKSAELKGAKDKAILGNAAKLAGASGEEKDTKWKRPDRNNVTNPFLNFKSGAGIYERLNSEETSSHKEFSAESWLESDLDN